jgi:hypothetical protein
MYEAGNLTVAITLLHRLLEMPDQEHLPEEALELSGSKRCLELELRHGYRVDILGSEILTLFEKM